MVALAPLSPLPTRGQTLLIAHRGARHAAPENTMVAFRRAIELGADAVELDVRLTWDGHSVIIHDASLDRTTAAAEGIFTDRIDLALGVVAEQSNSWVLEHRPISRCLSGC